MKNIVFATLCALIQLTFGIAHAQEVRSFAPGGTPAPATLGDMKGLIGNWAGPDSAAAFSAPLNDQIVGHLAISAGTAPRVEEIWIIRPEGGSITVRQKHFTPDLKSREDKDQWSIRPLVAVDAGHIYLDNATFVTKHNALELHVRNPGANGAAPQLLNWSMKRVK